MIVNLTPHDVNVLSSDGSVKIFPPGEETARLKVDVTYITTVDGVRITKSDFYKIKLPKEKKGKYYIVSYLVKNAFPERKDLLVPSEPVKNGNGRTLYCKSLGL